MCGIAAVIDFVSGVDYSSVIGSMLEVQATRGPDGYGSTSCRGVFLGHRMLRILPCPRSAQPMITEDGAYAIVYNGEIFNFRELRRMLQREGVLLRTDTDTEVILQLYRTRGAIMLNLLEGMFAFVIHDRVGREIFVARDRFGQKPLYCRTNGVRYAFASSMRALMLPAFGPSEVDSEALLDYLWTLDCYDSRSLVKNIRHVEPGTFLRIGESDGLIAAQRFISLTFSSQSLSVSVAEASNHLNELLAQSVRDRSAGVPLLASHLSGGMDSSAIVAHLAAGRGPHVVSYSCSYDISEGEMLPDERCFEESMYARMVASHLQIPNVQIRIGPKDYFLNLIDLIESIEEPKGNSCLPHYMLARCIGGRHRIFFSGEGADELLGGYTWKLRHSLCPTQEAVERGLWNAVIPAESEILTNLLRSPYDNQYACFQGFRKNLALTKGRPYLDSIMEYDLRHFLRYLLLQADKLAGRFSMEGRYPFLDNRLVDFLLSLPPALRFDAGMPSKPLLRIALESALPREILERRKVGFVPPEGGWFRFSMLDLVKDLLLGEESFVGTFTSRRALLGVIADHSQGKRNYRKLIWGLLSLELWHAIFFQGHSSAQIREHLHGMLPGFSSLYVLIPRQNGAPPAAAISSRTDLINA